MGPKVQSDIVQDGELCDGEADAGPSTTNGDEAPESLTVAPSVGARVNVVGRGMGVIAMDNEDGTWNVMFDDDSEADIPTAEAIVCEGNISDMFLGNDSANALVIWLHGCTDTPDGWHRIFSARFVSLLPYTRIKLPCAPMQFLSRAGKNTTSWYDLKTLPMTLSTPDLGTGQSESITKVLGMIEAAVADGIPPSRIVVGGHSQGGALALAVALQATVPIAGCVVFSGWVLPAQNLSAVVGSCPAITGGTRFLVTHGDQDSTVLPECGQSVARLLEEGGCQALDFRMVPGMGHCTGGLDSEEVGMVLQFLKDTLPPK